MLYVGVCVHSVGVGNDMLPYTLQCIYYSTPQQRSIYMHYPLLRAWLVIWYYTAYAALSVFITSIAPELVGQTESKIVLTLLHSSLCTLSPNSVLNCLTFLMHSTWHSWSMYISQLRLSYICTIMSSVPILAHLIMCNVVFLFLGNFVAVSVGSDNIAEEVWNLYFDPVGVLCTLLIAH